MALSNPEQPELKRFSFFVSRRFEEGRERFRLHMGYFSTLKEAEEWLGAVRDIYPGAWAGEAPGKKLRERAVAAAAAQAQHAAGPPPHMNVPTIHAAASPATGMTAAAPQVPKNVPVANPASAAGRPVAQPPVVNSAPLAKSAPAPSRAPIATAAPAPAATSNPLHSVRAAPTQGGQQGDGRTRTGAPLSAVPSPTAPGARPAVVGRSVPVAAPAAPRTLPVAVAAKPAPVAKPVPAAVSGSHPPTAHAPGVRAATAPGRPNSKGTAKAALPNSNVREVLKALEESPNEAEVTGETRMMPAPALDGLGSASDDNSFTDTQVLRYLETRRADGTEITGLDVETGAISLLKPDDTGTRRALKEAIAENAPVSFAVQLQWSVQPVELSKVPPLAIFSAYTLYTVEGSRDGRKWYGLRLGFFSDAISAKQVAYYVRSEFTSVAVVPVSPQERSRASDMEKKTSDLSFPKKARSGPVDEFKLIDSDEHPAGAQSRPAVAKQAGPAKTAPPVAAARRGPKTNGRVRAREHRAPQTLEETLEILGAGELEMDNGRGETLNESGVRHLRVEVQKNTPFGRLLERLSERVRKP
jgi:hypothetical protein